MGRVLRTRRKSSLRWPKSMVNFLGRLRGRARRISVSLVRSRTVRMVNVRPIVSFTFDDFPKSASLVGAKLLQNQGLAGTFYFSRSFCGRTVEGIEYYDMSDLNALAKEGHEIGCHTASHIHAPANPSARIVEDINSNGSFIRETLGDVRLTTFAFPFGDVDIRTKFLLQRRFAACRTTLSGFNRNILDLGALRAEKLYQSKGTDSVRRLISDAAQPRSWLIFYTHDVSDSPTAFGCTPTLLKAAIDAALSSGFDILTVRNALGPLRFRS
jgi:peptidoglycan/xylan/chitin deacetylase (PgdA/CDA1 family)